MAVLAMHDDDRKHRVYRGWANDALNASVGKLVRPLMEEPSIKGRALGRGS